MTFARMTKTSFAAALVVALGAVSAAAADPTPAALGYARAILTDVGMKGSLDRIVPTMLAELSREVLATHPELKDPLTQSILAVTPEFVASEETLFNDSVKAFASQMSEQDLQAAAAFFESAAGKNFEAAQPKAAAQIGLSAQAWREKLSTDILSRVREEMKKKGASF